MRKQRSRIANGKLSRTVDGRSAQARRWKELYAALVQELGGESRIAETTRQLVKRAATISVRLEQLEARLLDGRKIDDLSFNRLSATLSRLLRQIGVDKIRVNRMAMAPDLTNPKVAHPLDELADEIERPKRRRSRHD